MRERMENRGRRKESGGGAEGESGGAVLWGFGKVAD